MKHILLSICLYSLLSAAWGDFVGEIEYVQQTAERDGIKALVKADADIYHKLYGLTGKDTDLKRKVTEELSDAFAVVQDNAKAAERFLHELSQIKTSQELKNLLRQQKLKAYAETILEEQVAHLTGKGDDYLKKLIGMSDDGLDKAGRDALTVLAEAEAEITKTGQLSTNLSEKLAQCFKQLPPARARAARQLVRNQLAAKGINALQIFTRTGVDALFAAGDAYTIATSTDSAEEKTSKASGTIVGYALDTTANVAVRALGGGTLIHGFIISLSAGKVNALVTEAMLLQYDRQNAQLEEQWASIENRLNMVRGLIRADELIKAGELQKAQVYLGKLTQFYFKHAMDGTGIYEKIQELEGKIDKAGRLLVINQILAEARIPYLRAYQLVRQGRQLTLAKANAQEAHAILQQELGHYAELQTSLEQVDKLLALIDTLIAKAPPISKLHAAGAERVLVGAIETYKLTATGGLPLYTPLELNGLALTTGAYVYWQAPDKAGYTKVTFKVRDDKGELAKTSKTIEVVGDTPIIAENIAIPRLISIDIKASVETIDTSTIEKSSMFAGHPVGGNNTTANNINLALYRQTINNEGNYEINGANYQSHIITNDEMIHGIWSPQSDPFTIKDELILLFNPNSTMQLTGFKHLKNSVSKDGREMARMSISTQQIPFEKETSKTNTGQALYHYHFKGSISPYLAQCEYESSLRTHKGNIGMKWGRCATDWEIYINVEY